MTLEFGLCAAVLATSLLVVRRLPSWQGRVAMAGLFAAAAAAGRFRQDVLTSQTQASDAALARAPRQGRPGEFSGSQACRGCHPAEYESWRRSYHRTMTQHPSPQSVRGDFDDVTVEVGGEVYRMERRGDEFVATVPDPDWRYAWKKQQVLYRQGRAPMPPEDPGPAPRVTKTVSLLTGSHHMQVYWAKGPDGNMQIQLPVTYLFEARRWVPRSAAFLTPPDKPFPVQVWNANCLLCHATFAQPRQDGRSWAFDTECVQLGIACESCHGPGERHVEVNSDPRRRYALHRRDHGDDTIFNPRRADHVKGSEACGQCHAVRSLVDKQRWNFEGLPFGPGADLERYNRIIDYETSIGGADEQGRMELAGSFWRDGMPRVAGREYSGMRRAPCFRRGKLACVSCHSMHRYEDVDDQLSAGMGGDKACAECHAGIAAHPESHTHHAPGSSGSRCYNCHMPFTTYGLLKAIRSHQISSPTVAESLEVGRPNACNLCHLDRSLSWTAEALRKWYGKGSPEVPAEQAATAAALAWALAGDAAQRALIAWHMGWNPAMEASSPDWMPAYLADLLDDPYPAVRFIAERSLRRHAGFENFEYDFVGPAAERLRASSRARAIWRHRWPGRRRLPSPEALVGAEGVRGEAVAALRARRDDRPVQLQE